MSKGWIKIHRKIIESRVFAKPELLKLWLMCLVLANHEEGWVDIDGQIEPVKVRRGQFVTGRYSLHANYYPKKRKSNKSPITVWRWLEKLERWGKLNIKTNNKYSLVEIINYDYYQSERKDDQQNDQVNEHQVNNRRTSTEHQLNTNKNEKNVKNEKKYTIMSDFKWDGEQPIDYLSFVESFNATYQCRLRVTGQKRESIRGRLRAFTGAEIFQAWSNRLKDDWLTGEGAKYLANWNAAMRNDEKIEKYLTQNLPTHEQPIDKARRAVERTRRIFGD